MDKFKEIRPIVLGLAIKNNKILVSEGYDKVKDETFYRCLGGGIEFLEKSEEALKREFMEEINIDITVRDFLGISENIFTCQGKKAHELILFYSAKFSLPMQQLFPKKCCLHLVLYFCFYYFIIYFSFRQLGY